MTLLTALRRTRPARQPSATAPPARAAAIVLRRDHFPRGALSRHRDRCNTLPEVLTSAGWVDERLTMWMTRRGILEAPAVAFVQQRFRNSREVARVLVKLLIRGTFDVFIDSTRFFSNAPMSRGFCAQVVPGFVWRPFSRSVWRCALSTPAAGSSVRGPVRDRPSPVSSLDVRLGHCLQRSDLGPVFSRFALRQTRSLGSVGAPH